MFSARSRYRNVPNLALADAVGRVVAAKDFRPLPPVTGRFRHTLAEGERLDHLAYKYYGEPTRWWRICDANPEFLAPQALIGAEPVVTLRFPLTFAGGSPPWAALLRALAALVGVEQVALDDDDSGIVVRHNRLNLGEQALVGAMISLGFTVGQAQPLGRHGKPIVIPPDTTS